MNKIQQLTALWTKLPKDYTKDRDFHFNISVWYSYADSPNYFVEHKGYLYEFSDSFDTMLGAETYLEQELIKQIKMQLDGIKMSHAEDYMHVSVEDWNAFNQELLQIEQQSNTILNFGVNYVEVP